MSEPVEHVIAQLLIDPGAAIGDRDVDQATARHGQQFDGRSIGAVLIRVSRQVQHDLAQHVLVSGNRHRTAGGNRPRPVTDRRQLRRDRKQERLDGHRHNVQPLDLAGPSQLQQSLDQPAHAVDLVNRDGDRLLALLGRGIGAFRDQLQVAAGDGKRSPQLV